jgi:hypothetical protein
VTSRVALLLIRITIAGTTVSSASARTPAKGTSMFVVQHDPRLCPSPACGGYWVGLANGVRTRCGNGRAAARCYVARTVDRHGRPFTQDVPEGALVRGAIELGLRLGDRVLDRLRVWAVYSPAGTATAGGGYYRVVDTGIRCIRAPCFSYRAGTVNASLPILASEIDLQASGATAAEIDRAQAALRTKDGLYARGRFAPSTDGGRAFRALRLYLRAPQPRA